METLKAIRFFSSHESSPAAVYATIMQITTGIAELRKLCFQIRSKFSSCAKVVGPPGLQDSVELCCVGVTSVTHSIQKGASLTSDEVLDNGNRTYKHK